MNEPWHKKVAREYKDEIIKSAIIALVVTFVFSVVYYLLGKSYEWRTMDMPEPTLTLRILSGLVFSTLGRLLYKLKFYLVLKAILVRFLKMYELYRLLKKIIWYFLMFVMGYYIVPWAMKVINFILTILLNAAMIIVYGLPHVGIFLVIFASAFYFLKKRNEKTTELPAPQTQ